MSTREQEANPFIRNEYKHGFVTEIDADTVPAGLNEDVIRLISGKKNEPDWLLEWRLKAYRNWLKMNEPRWSHVHYKPIDYQDISYYSAPRTKDAGPKSLDEVDPKLLETYEKLGIPLQEQKLLAGVAVDAVFDSVSVATTFKEKLAEAGVIFCRAKSSGSGAQIPWFRGARGRQLLCGAQFRGIHRRILLLCTEKHALSHGVVHVFPH